MPIGTFLNGRGTTRLRGLMFLAFSDVAVIQTPSVSSDGGGGGTTSWASVGTVDCRIYPVTMRGKGAQVGGQINERSTHFCSMPPGTPVDTSDRMVIAGRGTFEVTLALEVTDPLTTRVEVFQV